MKKPKLIKLIFLASILLLSSIVRLTNINHLPPSLFADEVDIGYQAMTLNQNGTDYFGNKSPLHFHSFSDWQPALGIYTVSIFQKFTNNPELSVRLPSAMFGILSTYLFFLITRSNIPGLLFAISPWAIHYGRTGFAVSEMICFILLGIYFWQKYISSQKTLFLYLFIFFFCLTPYIYSTAKLFLLFIPPLLFFIWKDFFNSLKPSKLIFPLLFAVILLLPMVSETFLGKAGYRFSYISIFTEPHREQVTDNLRYQDAVTDHPGEIGVKTSIISKVMHNKFQLVFQRFVSNYISSFSSEFLLLRGDANTRHGFGGHGLLYIVDSLFIFLGIYFFFSKKPLDKLTLLFLLILLISPIPYSLTRDSDSSHATRLILILPSLIYFIYLGIKNVITNFKLLTIPIVFIYTLSLFNFFHYYYYHYPHDSARLWHTGMKESVKAVVKDVDAPIVFSNSYEPFLPFFLFYYPYKLPPNSSIVDYIKNESNSSFEGQSLDKKYYFGNINWGNTSFFPQDSIFILPKSEYDALSLKNYRIVNTINKKYINQESFYIVSLNEN